MKVEFSLLPGEPLNRIQAAMGFNPNGRYFFIGRAIVLALLCWGPLAIWAFTHGSAFSGEHDPLLRHFGINVRFLIAVPILILSSVGADKSLQIILQRFVDSGMVRSEDHRHFQEVLDRSCRVFSNFVPWLVIVIIGALLNWFRMGASIDDHEMIWAINPIGTSAEGSFAYARWWFLCVSSPIFTILLGGWCWGLVVVTLLFARIARMDLDLVATHPDRLAGLGFIKRLPRIFVGFTFSISAVLAGRWAHDLYFHEETLAGLKAPFFAMAGALILFQMLPLLVFSRKLYLFRRNALYQYGLLLTKHGRLVRDRWILGKQIPEDKVLEAQELGPLTDINAVYEAVKDMRAFPIDRDSVLLLLAPIVIPFIPLLLIKMPIKELFNELLNTLI